MVGTLFLLAAGLVLLWKGADLLSEGAVGVAERMGVSQLVIGLTIVAMGTSAPEAAAGITAALDGKGDIILGNVYGANIADLAFIGGVVSLIRPLQVRVTTLKREIPAMLAVTLLLLPLLKDLTLSRLDGAILIVVFLLLLTFTIYTARASAARGYAKESHEAVKPPRNVGWDILFMAIGLAVLAIGARMAVHSAEAIGRHAGLSDAVIGSTILAIGTTLPELMTCLVATVKGHHDISVGNLVGSTIFNTLAVTGLASLVRPLLVSPRFAGGMDYWIVIGVGTGFAATVLVGRRTIHRVSGVVLLVIYAGYIAYLLRSTPAG